MSNRLCGFCHDCGAKLRHVLDGEEWCDGCKAYRRYPSHGWTSGPCSDTDTVCPPRMYPNWESAEAAMERGETVRIEMEPLQIDPALLQLALDLEHKDRLEQWRESCRLERER